MGLVIAMLIGALVAGTSPARADATDKGVIGATRAQVEATFGKPTEAVPATGRPTSDAMFAYGTQAGMAYVSYREINGVQIAVAAEFAWGGGGVSEADAGKLIAKFLPADAKLTELYIAPATPDGPIALSVLRYTSEDLGHAYNGVLAPEVIAIENQTWNAAANATAVTRVSLALRERTQLTG